MDSSHKNKFQVPTLGKTLGYARCMDYALESTQ